MSNSYNYPYASSSANSGNKKTSVSSIATAFESTSLADCSAMDFSPFSPMNVFFVLFHLDNDSYIKNFRFAVGAFTQGAQPRFATWDTGSEYVNGTGGATTFRKVEEKVWPDSIFDTGLFMSTKQDFATKLRAGWCAISLDQVESAQRWYFMAKQTLSQFSTPSVSNLCVYQMSLAVGSALPATTFFANNGSNNASVVPWLKFNEVAA